MITNFKLYEKNIHLDRWNDIDVEIGDYVLMSIESKGAFSDFINNNMGQIYNKSSIYLTVKYENIPENIQHWFYQNTKKFVRIREDNEGISVGKILKFSKNKEDIEDIIMANKYNL